MSDDPVSDDDALGSETGFSEAMAYWRSRVPMTDEEFAQLEQDAGARAFRVAGIADLDLVGDIWQALDDAIATGTGFQEFKSAVADRIAGEWGAPDSPRLATVWRTNIQTAYNAGRYAQQNHPAVREARPYLEFVAIPDARECEICEPCNDTVLPASAPWWSQHQAPLHYSCRCTAVTLSPAEADEVGVDDDGPDSAPLEGFGRPPSLGDWTPDLASYPAELQHAARKKGL